MAFVASSARRAMRDMFLATIFVLCEAAINQAAVPVSNLLSEIMGKRKKEFNNTSTISLSSTYHFCLEEPVQKRQILLL